MSSSKFGVEMQKSKYVKVKILFLFELSHKPSQLS